MNELELLTKHRAVKLHRDPREIETLAEFEGKPAPVLDPNIAYVWYVGVAGGHGPTPQLAAEDGERKSNRWYGIRGSIWWGWTTTLEELFDSPAYPPAV